VILLIALNYGSQIYNYSMDIGTIKNHDQINRNDFIVGLLCAIDENIQLSVVIVI
jgi:hypothetical protein